ncbi:MAG: tetratricopeptide repeat protein [Chloroflexi bacterium]|nr:tetratricopeptide repeat protein [Chloroflexota bacterium]
MGCQVLKQVGLPWKSLALDLSQKEGLTERVEQLDAEALQIQTHLAVCDLLTHAAQVEALVLILDDLHWADSGSLELLKFALDRVSDRSPVFFCLVYRPRKDRPIWQAWQEIEKLHPDCLSISLAELGNADSRQLLFNLLQTEQVTADFQEMILRETDGNPLYVEELLRSLMDEGTIVRDDDSGWRVEGNVEHIRVPDTLQQIIQSRIDELDKGSSGARRALWMASVIGEEFNEDVWLQLFTSTGRQEEKFFLHLRVLKGMDMVHEIERVEEGRTRWLYQFRHGLVQQVAYENMLVERRREYHREVGRLLEIRYSDRLREQYDALARHYERGQVWAKALDYHLKAGQKAQQAYANAEATMHFERALAMAERVSPDPGGDRIAAMEGLGAVLKVTGDFDAALGHLEAALTLLEESDVEKKRQAVTCHQIGRIHEMKGNYETAMDWVERGRTVLSGVEGAELAAARLHLLAGIVAVRRGDLTTAFEEAEQALSLAETAHASPEAAQTHNLLGVLHRERGELEQAAFHCERSLALYEQIANPLKVATVLNNLGTIAFDQDDWMGSVEAQQRALAIHKEVGDVYNQVLVLCNLADTYCHQGRLEQALVYAQEGLKGSKVLKSVFGLIHAYENLGAVYLRQEELTQARAHLEEGLRLIDVNDVQELGVRVRILLTEAYLQAGESTEAESVIDQALAVAMEQGASVDEAIARRVLGQAFQAQGNVAKAKEALQASRTILESEGQRYELGRTLLVLAALYVDDDRRQSEGRAALIQAHAIFEDLGAALDLAEAKALSQRIAMDNE